MEAKSDVSDFISLVEVKNERDIVGRVDTRLEQSLRLPPGCLGLIVGEESSVVTVSGRAIVTSESKMARRRVRTKSRRCLSIKGLGPVQTASV